MTRAAAAYRTHWSRGPESLAGAAHGCLGGSPRCPRLPLPWSPTAGSSLPHSKPSGSQAWGPWRWSLGPGLLCCACAGPGRTGASPHQERGPHPQATLQHPGALPTPRGPPESPPSEAVFPPAAPRALAFQLAHFSKPHRRLGSRTPRRLPLCICSAASPHPGAALTPGPPCDPIQVSRGLGVPRFPAPPHSA